MRRIRRRPRVVWITPERTGRFNGTATASTDNANGRFFVSLTGPYNAGDQTTAVVAVFGDQPVTTLDVGQLNGLSQQFSSAYRLRRIVGKIFVGCEQTTNNSGSYAYVTAGLIVLRCDPNGQPIGALAGYSNQNFDGWSDPWIWRRTWMLGNLSNILLPGSTDFTMPENNTQMGSVMDGPHVDAKTARTVGQEERVFLVVSLSDPFANAAGTPGPQISVFYDLRGVVSLRQNQGNRNNASR